MKNITEYITGALVLLMLITGCNDFLGSLPRGQIIAKTTSDFRKLLDMADNERYRFSFTQTYSHVDVASDNVYAEAELLDSWINTREHYANMYRFADQVWTYQALTDDMNWKTLYYVNSTISSILSEIHKADDNVALQNQLRAEAKVHRAYVYLLLVNIYAKHYNPATASTDPGVPIVTAPSSLPSLKRASVQKVYDFIISELTDAVEHLPADRSQYTHRPSKGAVYAILARTYLYMGDYVKALEYANKALEIRDFLYDYNTIYTGLPHVDNLQGISRMQDQEMYLHKTTKKGESLSEYMILERSAFNELFDGFTVTAGDTVNQDLRRSLWFDGLDMDENVVTDTVAFVFNDAQNRYSVDGFNSDAADNLPIATPEMYLTRAECNAREGNLEEALDDLNTLRVHRYKTGSYTAVDTDDFGGQQEIIEEVLLERRRELYGRELRLFDLKRLGLPVTHVLPEGGTVEVEANDPKLIWPIFDGYIEKNPELEQNLR